MRKRCLAMLLAFAMLFMNFISAAPAIAGATDMPLRDPELIQGFYFESQAEADEWTLVDADGDGSNWGWFGYGVNYLNFATGNQAYEGMGMISSASLNSGNPLTPDNWIISPAVALPAGEASLTFYVRARIPSSVGEHFAVYAGTAPEISAMTEICPETEATAEYVQLSADLSDFAGGNVYIAFRNFNSTGINGVAVDQAEIWSLGGSEPSPTGEPEPTATPEPVMSDLDLALNIEGGTIHFENDAAYPWYTVEKDGRFYAQAGNSGYLPEYSSTLSEIKATVTVSEDSVVRFDYLARGFMTDPVWDHCDFIVDSMIVWRVGDMGEEWLRFGYALTPGTHVLKWRFYKFMYNPNVSNEPADLYALDNVYIEPKVETTGITASETLEIEVDRTGYIEWNVLPEDAFDRDVIFSIDDPTIATVNEDGRVIGLSVGTAHITTALAVDPSIYAVTEIHVVDSGLHTARIYGRVGYSPSNQLIGRLITFTEIDPDYVSVVADLDYASAGAAYAYGKIYGFLEDGTFYYAEMDDPTHPVWLSKYNDGMIVSMAFDYTRSMLFGLSLDGDGLWHLVSIDPNTGAVVNTGDIYQYDLISSLAIDEEGIGYYVNKGGDLYKIDLDTAECTKIGSTGVTANYLQDMCYDFDNGYLYWAQFCDLNSNGLYRIDKETAEAEYLGKIANSSIELVGMFIIPSNEPEPQSPVTSVYILPGDLLLEIGETAELSAHVLPFTAENTNVVWSVDNEEIVSIDQEGHVKGLALGTALVTVTTEDGGFTASVTVRVGSVLTGFFFEKEAEVSAWQFIDKDGDGYNWIWSGTTNTNIPAYEGMGIVFSESYSNSAGIALTPDNWAISSPVEIPECQAVVSLYAKAADPAFPYERFAIYAGISPDPNEMECISEVFTVTGQYLRYEADLSRFAGETVYIAIRHFDCTDQFILCVDDVEVWQVGEELPEPPELPAMGDANGDGVVDFVDALLVLRHALDIMELPEYLFPILDVDGDGSITVADALLILRYAMGLVPSL